MALKATVFKAELQVTDLNRHYYASHALTLARHPSETDERMMLRVLAYALFASEALQFTRGLSSDDEPELWERDATGELTLWIEVGQPDERRIRQALGRSRRVVVLCYGGRVAELWWQRLPAALRAHERLCVLNVSAEHSAALTALVERGMRLQATLDGDGVWLTADAGSAEVTVVRWPETAS